MRTKVSMSDARLSVIHDHHEKLAGGLVREPVPTMLRIILDIVQLRLEMGVDAVGGNEVIQLQGTVVAHCERPVLKFRDQRSPCVDDAEPILFIGIL
jgi:hypothetical protein